jgi:transposase-like protein
MRRKQTDEPATALRAALASPWPELRQAAARVIRRALRGAGTVGEAAQALGVGRRTLERIRRDFPEISEGPEKST